MKNLKKVVVLVAFVAFNFACNNDDSTNTPVNEEEVITTVTTVLTGGGQVITLTSKDLDGEGPNAPIQTVSGNLTAGTTYVGSTTFKNELVNPVADITTEIEEEGPAHQVFYKATPAVGTISYATNNVDVNGKPIGLRFNFVAGSVATTGTFSVTLKHLPNKSAAGVAQGDITNAGGATDAQVIFQIAVN